MAQVIHLKDDNDNLGEANSWCGNEISPRCSEWPNEVTCKECLKKIVEYASKCEARLSDLAEAER